MARRRDARRLAIQLVYQAHLTGRDPRAVLEERVSLGQRVPGFARDLVTGVGERLADLDGVLGQHAEEWTVARMAGVDRAILRVACHELLHRDDVPASVAVSEAVSLAGELSTEDSGRFINGVLGRIAAERAETGT